MTRKLVRVSRPPATLAVLINRSGGMSRSVAIARSTERMETQRAPARDAVVELISQMETTTGPGLSTEQMRELSRSTDQVIALAMMFDMDTIAGAAKRLSKIIGASNTDNRSFDEAIALHVRALHLFASSPSLAPTLGNKIVEDLDKVLNHFGIPTPDA